VQTVCADKFNFFEKGEKMKGKNIFRFLALVLMVCSPRVGKADRRWGRLANPDFDGYNIKTTLFFSGQAKDGTFPYECTPGSNLFLYTVHPTDSRHLNWAVSPDNRTFVMDKMIAAGINVIAMSSWGEDFLPCTTAWTPWAPMQCSTYSHDELFVAATGKRILIMPFIESRADWTFRGEFPTWEDIVAPGTVSQIINLIDRYLKNPSHPEWADKWARVYNRDGQPRHAVAIIHASSDRLTAKDDAAYADGFDSMAEVVFKQTGINVGFFIDALPRGTYAPGVFTPSSQTTAPYLENKTSILGIMCFIPEIWVGTSDEGILTYWKRLFSDSWAATGIPFLMDVSPGYDAHIVFPGSALYGLNITWTKALTEMVDDFGQDGLVYNSWNGYTEGMAAVELEGFGDYFYNWLGFLTCKYHLETCMDIIRCKRELPGDIHKDCKVNLFDLAILAENWLESNDPQYP
jgi:hypothetical protein